MQKHDKTIKLAADVPHCLNTKFSYNASQIFLFKKGWKRLAIIEAIKMWIWIVNNDSELYESLKEKIELKSDLNGRQ